MLHVGSIFFPLIVTPFKTCLSLGSIVYCSKVVCSIQMPAYFMGVHLLLIV